MIKKISKREKINFLLENKHYQKLHLYLYLVTVLLIVLIYYLLILIFSPYSPNLMITGILSITIGIGMVYYRDRIVKKISDYLENKKRVQTKTKNKSGLKTTLRKITPKNKKLKLDIKGKTTLKEKLDKVKKKFSKKNKTKKSPDYIELK